MPQFLKLTCDFRNTIAQKDKMSVQLAYVPGGFQNQLHTFLVAEPGNHGNQRFFRVKSQKSGH